MIRAATPKDASAILGIYGPMVISSYVSFETERPSLEEICTRIENSYIWLVHEEEGEVNGYAYASRFHPRAGYAWSAEVSIYLADEARGRGIGKALLTPLLNGLRTAGFVNTFAGVALPNPASVALFESFGFEKIAHQRNVGFKLDRWLDVGWWQLELRPPTLPPPPIPSPS